MSTRVPKFTLGIPVIAALSLLSGIPPRALAQRVSVGVTGGGYTNSDFRSSIRFYSGFPPIIVDSDAGGYIIGPALDVALNPRFSIGAEALYKPLHYRDSAGPATVVTWQFPVLARYRLPMRGITPFIEGGPSFRSAGNLNSADPSHIGLTAGAGIEKRWGRLRIAPEVRYTRWASDGRRADLVTRPDQIEFLVRTTYAAAPSSRPLGRRVSIGAVFATTVTGDFAPGTDTFSSPELGIEYTLRTSSGPRGIFPGALVEATISEPLSIEANAIAREFRSTTERVGGVSPQPVYGAEPIVGSFSTREFPVLAKWRLTAGIVRPFLAIGPSFRIPKKNYYYSACGATAGAGVEIRWKMLRFSPSLRYARWANDRDLPPGERANSGLRTNQVALLAGVSF